MSRVGTLLEPPLIRICALCVAQRAAPSLPHLKRTQVEVSAKRLKGWPPRSQVCCCLRLHGLQHQGNTDLCLGMVISQPAGSEDPGPSQNFLLQTWSESLTLVTAPVSLSHWPQTVPLSLCRENDLCKLSPLTSSPWHMNHSFPGHAHCTLRSQGQVGEEGRSRCSS